MYEFKNSTINNKQSGGDIHRCAGIGDGGGGSKQQQQQRRRRPLWCCRAARIEDGNTPTLEVARRVIRYRGVGVAHPKCTGI